MWFYCLVIMRFFVKSVCLCWYRMEIRYVNTVGKILMSGFKLLNIVEKAKKEIE